MAVDLEDERLALDVLDEGAGDGDGDVLNVVEVEGGGRLPRVLHRLCREGLVMTVHKAKPKHSSFSHRGNIALCVFLWEASAKPKKLERNLYLKSQNGEKHRSSSRDCLTVNQSSRNNKLSKPQ